MKYVDIYSVCEVNMHYLYKITNALNGKVYIGQTNNIKLRWSTYKSATKSDKPYAKRHVIVRAMKKYGIDNFLYEHIATCKTQDESDYLEEILICQYDSRNNSIGYNINPGGKTKSPSEETKKKMSEASRRNWQIPEYREKMLAANEPTRFKPGHKFYDGDRPQTFKPGHQTWNKGTRGIMKVNSGSFKKGQISHNKGKPSSRKGKTWKMVNGKRIWFKKETQ